MKSDLEHARELGRQLKESGASGVEVVDTIVDAFSEELSRLAAYREVYKSQVAQRLRQAKGA
jgi:hypothetical protein